MKKNTTIFLIIELQIILALLIFGLYKIYDIERDVFLTNSFVVQALSDNKLNELQNVDDNDIILGDKNASVSIFMYTKFSCPYCKEFFEQTYPEIYQDFIASGQVNLVVRYLTTPESAQGELVNMAYQSYFSGVFNEFTETISEFEEKDLTEEQKNEVYSYLGLQKDIEYNKVIKEKYKQAFMAGVVRTPTFIINGKKILGNRKMKVFKEEINTAIEMCDQ